MKDLVDLAIGGADHNDRQEEHGERSWADLVSGDQDQVSDSTMSILHSHFSTFIFFSGSRNIKFKFLFLQDHPRPHQQQQQQTQWSNSPQKVTFLHLCSQFPKNM